MTEPLKTIQFTFAPTYAISPNSTLIRYAGDWIYIADPLGVTRVHSKTGKAQYTAVGWKKQQQYYFPGKYATNADSYQCVTWYAVTPRWLVTVYNGNRQWYDSRGTMMLSHQVYRVSDVSVEWYGQFHIDEYTDKIPTPGFPRIGGNIAEFPSGTLMDLSTLRNAPYSGGDDSQKNIEGCTYIMGQTTGVLNQTENTQMFTLLRQGVWTGVPDVEPPPPPTTEPPPPTTEPPPPTTEPPPPPPETPDLIAVLTRIAVAVEKIAG